MKAQLGFLVPTLVLLAAGCMGDFGGKAPQSSPPDTGPITTPWNVDGGPPPPKADSGPKPNYDAFFANDPQPQYCGPPGGGGTPPPLPGGTPECPSDKNREGCPCAKQGGKAACWPGYRKHRNRGICTDGTATCVLTGEHTLTWGPCEGYVLPKPGATKGADACRCFSQGKWEIDNLTPCFIEYPGKKLYAVSTTLDPATGKGKCPNTSNTPPPKPPTQPWSKNRLTVDCAGQFKLCYTLKAGDVANPSASDCVLAQVCVDFWYQTANVERELPDLPAWSSTDTACAAKFDTVGGYGEMTVLGKSIECDPVDDNGKPLVFHWVSYCPLICATTPTLPQCKGCGNGASGSF